MKQDGDISILQIWIFVSHTVKPDDLLKLCLYRISFPVKPNSKDGCKTGRRSALCCSSESSAVRKSMS